MVVPSSVLRSVHRGPNCARALRDPQGPTQPRACTGTAKTARSALRRAAVSAFTTPAKRSAKAMEAHSVTISALALAAHPGPPLVVRGGQDSAVAAAKLGAAAAPLELIGDASEDGVDALARLGRREDRVDGDAEPPRPARAQLLHVLGAHARRAHVCLGAHEEHVAARECSRLDEWQPHVFELVECEGLAHVVAAQRGARVAAVDRGEAAVALLPGRVGGRSVEGRCKVGGRS